MKHMKKAHLVICLLGILITAGQAQAGAFLTMDPGEAAVREFVLYDPFDARTLKPMELFLVLGMGDNETKLGDLTITVKPTATKEYGAVLDYAIMGIAVPLGGGTPVMLSATSTAPLELKKVAKLNGSTYALVLAGVYIKEITGYVDRPVKFSINFSWAVGK